MSARTTAKHQPRKPARNRHPKRTTIRPLEFYFCDFLFAGKRRIRLVLEDNDTGQTVTSEWTTDGFRNLMRVGLDMAAELGVAERELA